MHGYYGFMVLHTYTSMNMDVVVLLVYELNGSTVRHKKFTKPGSAYKHCYIYTVLVYIHVHVQQRTTIMWSRGVNMQ